MSITKQSGLYNMQCLAPSKFNYMEKFMAFLNDKYFVDTPSYFYNNLLFMKTNYESVDNTQWLKIIKEKSCVKVENDFIIEIEYNDQLDNNMYTIKNVDMSDFEANTLKHITTNEKVLFNISKANWEKNVFILVKYKGSYGSTCKCNILNINYTSSKKIKTEKTEVINFNVYYKLINSCAIANFGHAPLVKLHNFESFYKYINLYYLANVVCPDINVFTYYNDFTHLAKHSNNLEAIMFTYYPENIREYNQGSEYNYSIVNVQLIVDFESTHNNNKNTSLLSDVNTHLANSGNYKLVIVTYPHVVAPDERCIFEMKSVLIKNS